MTTTPAAGNGVRTLPPRPQPPVGDQLMAPFWEATREHRLVVRRCDNCGRYQWPSRPMCAGCHTVDFSWVDAPTVGEVYSFTVARRAFHAAFAERVPYVVVVVELLPGVRMVGNLLGSAEVRIGATVRAEFVDGEGDTTLVCWRPAKG